MIKYELGNRGGWGGGCGFVVGVFLVGWLVVFFTNNYKYNSKKIYYILYTEHTISIRVRY